MFPVEGEGGRNAIEMVEEKLERLKKWGYIKGRSWMGEGLHARNVFDGRRSCVR